MKISNKMKEEYPNIKKQIFLFIKLFFMKRIFLI